MNESQHDAIAVIIGRAGSKGLPGKNSRLVAGLPMVAHAIGHARSSRHVRQVVVEVHDQAGRADAVEALLRTHGLTEIVREQEAAFVETALVNLFARRPAQ